MAGHRDQENASGRLSRLREIFGAFLMLGLTSFGGPIAHLGYFRAAFVARRRWMSEEAYGDLVALCQFLPGPASSQVGFAIGLSRGGGVLGGLAAWAGFTLPSAILLAVFGLAAARLSDPLAAGAIHGLKLVAVAVVAQAVWGMARTLAPDRQRAAIATVALALSLLVSGAGVQMLAIAAGALAGLVLCRSGGSAAGDHLHIPVTRRAGLLALALAGGLLVACWMLPASGGPAALFAATYQAGMLVFGGGHVVLPLLESLVVAPGWVGAADFLAGYGLAQAVPGPLFTFAAYLGAASSGGVGALAATIGIFLPGLLLVYGALPFWGALRRAPLAQAAMRGANAAVVGILAAAFYTPVWTSAVTTPLDVVLAAAGFVLLTAWQAPPLLVVVLLAAAGALLA